MNIEDGSSGYAIGNRDPRKRGRGVNARNIKRGKRRWGCLTVILLLAVTTAALATLREAPTAHLGSVYPSVACDQEDGSGAAQAYPCVWDARVRGNRTYGDGYPPVLVYVRGSCPSLPPVARCFRVDPTYPR